MNAPAAPRWPAWARRVALGVAALAAAAGLAACASRVIVTTDDASQVETLISALKSSLSNTASQIVFLTSSRDTRFTACGVLRPLIEENS